MDEAAWSVTLFFLHTSRRLGARARAWSSPCVRRRAFFFSQLSQSPVLCSRSWLTWPCREISGPDQLPLASLITCGSSVPAEEGAILSMVLLSVVFSVEPLAPCRTLSHGCCSLSKRPIEIPVGCVQSLARGAFRRFATCAAYLQSRVSVCRAADGWPSQCTMWWNAGQLDWQRRRRQR